MHVFSIASLLLRYHFIAITSVLIWHACIYYESVQHEYVQLWNQMLVHVLRQDVPV